MLDRDNLTAETGAHVTEVLFDGDAATGVAYVQDGNRREVSADEVVLSAGAIDSPRLLMLSGVGPADHLEEHDIDVRVDSPGVGQNLQDHLVASAAYECTADPEITPGEVLCQITGFESTDQGLRAPDIQYFLARVYFMRHGFDNPEEGDGMTPSCTLLRPQSTGEITLASDDPFDDPLIDPNYLDDPQDVETLVAGMERVREIGNASVLDDIRGDEGGPRATTWRPTFGRPPRPSTTPSGRRRWATTTWQWWTTGSASTARRASASWTPRSCPGSRAGTPTRRRSPSPSGRRTSSGTGSNAGRGVAWTVASRGRENQRSRGVASESPSWARNTNPLPTA